ncbi:biotin/lipoyl-binding protein [bacterium]|nr:biotin/lipoyl-binding protein [bacterium]
MAGGVKQPPTALLPALRGDIRYFEHGADGAGQARWRIHDPLQHRYFSIGEDTRHILSIWKAGMSPDELAAAAKARFALELSPAGLARLTEFLDASNLLVRPDEAGWRELGRRQEALQSKKRLQWLTAYLFVKIPLVNPEALLAAAKPWTDPLFTRAFSLGMLAILLAGLYLSFHDMLAQLSASLERFSLHGVLLVGVALVILKTGHELGHAVTASRYGCRVPTLGVAFMMFVPLLYSDVTDAWRLQSRRQRLLISAAGLIAELYLAAIATFAWAFLPDGAARDVAFYVASVGWISSIAINLNPFARFDGYYILSDLAGIENLQPRAFALARWKMRQVLLLPGLHAPEQFRGAAQAALILFAMMTWAYRLAIFTGIAIFLYFATAKIIGIVLLCFTLVRLLVLPLWREIAASRRLVSAMRSEARLNRPLFLFAAVLAALFIPFAGSVEAPAVLGASDLQKIFPPRDARIAAIAIQQSGRVKAGDVLVRFDVPELGGEMRELAIELDAARRRLARAVSNLVDRSQLAVLRNDVLALERRQRQLAKDARELDLVSRMDGDVVQTSRDLRQGGWIARDRWVAIIRSGEGALVRGYLDEDGLDRVRTGDSGRFVPEDPSQPSLAIVVGRISPDAVRRVDLPELASRYGGPIETGSQGGIALTPAHPVFPVEFRPASGMKAPDRATRGAVVIDGRRRSFAAMIWRRAARVLVKETSF